MWISYVNYVEQEQSCVRELQKGNDVLAVLLTAFGKSRILKAFRRVGFASPLVSRRWNACMQARTMRSALDGG